LKALEKTGPQPSVRGGGEKSLSLVALWDKKNEELSS